VHADVAAYAVNQDAVRHAKWLIDARQYVLRSRWQNAFAQTFMFVNGDSSREMSPTVLHLGHVTLISG